MAMKHLHWLRNKRGFFLMVTCFDFLAPLVSELNFYIFPLAQKVLKHCILFSEIAECAIHTLTIE